LIPFSVFDKLQNKICALGSHAATKEDVWRTVRTQEAIGANATTDGPAKTANIVSLLQQNAVTRCWKVTEFFENLLGKLLSFEKKNK